VNPKRKTTKVVRVTEELLDSVSDIAEAYGVAKRDVLDALLEDFLYNDKKDPNRKFRVFQSWVSRYNLRTKAGRGTSTMNAPPQNGSRDTFHKGSDVPNVPDWMK
jgi:hypothetical protein